MDLLFQRNGNATLFIRPPNEHLVAVQIIVDLSRAAAIGDMRPNRLAVMAGVLQGFIRKFFDENPLSHLGLIIMRNGIAERLTELAGSPVNTLPENTPASHCIHARKTE